MLLPDAQMCQIYCRSRTCLLQNMGRSSYWLPLSCVLIQASTVQLTAQAFLEFFASWFVCRNGILTWSILIISAFLQIIEKLSVSTPTGEAKLKQLKEIAQEYNLEWDSSNTEAEFSKKHEDLLVFFQCCFFSSSSLLPFFDLGLVEFSDVICFITRH